MAIKETLIRDLGAPYVHSQIQHFTSQAGNLSKSDSYLSGLEQLQENLGRWIEQLKQQENVVYNACQVEDYQQLNRKLFQDSKDNYQKVALAVLNNRDFVTELVPKINQELSEKVMNELIRSTGGINGDKYIQEVLKIVGLDVGTLSTGKFVSLLTEAIGNVLRESFLQEGRTTYISTASAQDAFNIPISRYTFIF